MEKRVQRGVVDISMWNPTPNAFSFALSVLPRQAQSSITRFVKMEDSKWALVRRLPQYALVQQVLGIPYKEIIIKRTIEGKPYLVPVAKGHPRSTTESYKRTLTRSDFNLEDYNEGLYLPNAPFLSQTAEQLISILCKANRKLDVEQNT